MKKFALLILLALVFTQASIAQVEDIRIGFQLSPVLSWLSTDDDLINSNGSNLGLRVSALGEIPVTDKYAVTVGLGLTFNQGGSLLYEIGGNLFPDSELSDESLNSGVKPIPDNARVQYHLQYVEIPMGFKIRIADAGDRRYYVELPILTLGINAQARGEFAATDLDTKDENISKDINLLHLSWGFGGGIEYDWSQNNTLMAGLYFQRGFNDINTDDGSRAAYNPEQRPSDPDDDYIITQDRSNVLINSLTLRLAILF